ncbi:MAG: class I SAM-dependent methyltransferase [Thermoleophilia bacterium]|nr:class I SAM-dependent methyltransferase [Thermoleophilia bacterium]
MSRWALMATDDACLAPHRGWERWSGSGYGGRVDVDNPTCPRCGAPSRMLTAARDRHGRGTVDVHECESAVCGVGFTWPSPSASSAAPTLGASGEGEDRLVEWVINTSVAALASRLRPGALVVDVGAGSGLRARALAGRGFEVIAIEPDVVEVTRARAVLSGTDVPVAVAPVEAIGDVLGSRMADAVVMWHVIEHVGNPDLALDRVHDALRPGGLVSIAVPNRRSAEAAVFGERWHGWEPSRHVWHFDERSLRIVLGAAGFSVAEIGTKGGWGYPSGLAYSLAPGLDPQVTPSRGRWGRALTAAMIPVALGARAVGRGSQLVTIGRRPGSS